MATAPPNAPSAPKRRGCLRAIAGRLAKLGLFAVLVGCLVVVGWLNSEGFQRFAQGEAERLIERQTGEQLSMSRVDIRFWPPALDVRGLNLFHEPTGDTILSAQKLLVPVVFTWRGPRLGVIRLDHPVVQLHLENGSFREFANAVKGKRDNPIRELPMNGVEIKNGTFRLVHPKGEVGLSDVSLQQRVDYAHELSFDLDIQQGRYARSFPIEVASFDLGPRSVRFPDLQVHTEPLDLTGNLTIPLQGDLDGDLSLLAHLDTLTELLAPPRDLHGELAADIELRGPLADPEAGVSLWATGLGFDAPGVKVPVLHYRFEEITAAARANKRRIHVDDLAAYWGGGTVRLTGIIDPVAKELLDARAVGDSVSFHDLLIQLDGAPTPWIDMICDAEVRVSGPLLPLRLEGTFDFNVADLLVTSGPVRDPSSTKMLDIPAAWARGDLVLEKDHVRLIAPDVYGPNTSGSVDVDIGFKSYGPLDLRADLQADLSDFQPLGGVELGGIGPIAGRIRGPFDKLVFEGTGDLESFSVLGLPFADRLEAPVFRSSDLKSIELVGAKATVGKSAYGGDFLFDFRPPMSMRTDVAMRDGRVQDILGVFIDLEGITGSMTGSLSLDGPLFDMDGRSDFTYKDVSLYGERFPTGTSRSFMDTGIFTLDDLRLLRRNGTEGILLRGTVAREWALDMDLLADGFALERVDNLETTLPLSGKLSAWANIENTLFDPAPRGRASLVDVRYAGQPVADSTVDFHTLDSVVQLDGDLLGGAVRGGGTVGLWGEQPYAVQADLRQFPAHLFYPVGADGSPVRAEASGTIALEGTAGGDASPVRLRGELSDVQVDWAGHELRNQNTWTYQQSGKTYKLDNFDLSGGRTSFAVAAIGGDTLELDGEGTIELDLLRAVVPGLQRAEGVGEVQLAVQGSAPNVQAVVDIDVQADLLRYETIPAAFEELTTTVHLTQDRFEFEDVRGSIGGGNLEGGGVIEAVDWTPARYDLRGSVENAQVQWVDTLPPAIGDATLRFDGPADQLLLEGEVIVDDMAFTDRIDWEDWVVEYRSEVMVDPSADAGGEGLFDMNVHVLADRTVRLRNNLAEGTASADLRLVGDTARPGIVGWARVDDGLIILQDRTFRVDRGEINYNDPFSWDPDVDFDMVTDIESRNQRYRVNYQLFGPFSDWRTSTRSDPGLPQADVNALLWFGVTTDELEQSGELPTAVAQGVADLLLTDLFASTQASELGEVPDLLFDSIDVATGVNGRGEYSAEPRLVVSKRLTELGDVDLTWEFNLGRPEDNYIRVDKRVGGIWSIAGWYATLQRDRVLPIGGAYGVDVTARWEMD